jgi:hypothetical protein
MIHGPAPSAIFIDHQGRTVTTVRPSGSDSPNDADAPIAITLDPSGVMTATRRCREASPTNAITRVALRMGNQTFEHQGWLFRLDNDSDYEHSWCPSHWPAADPI